MQPSFPAVHGVTHRFVNANSVNLHLAESGNGEPLLMLHGWPQHW
jgi:pimeloyl-ACP methyl ester carboxylesterase